MPTLPPVPGMSPGRLCRAELPPAAEHRHPPPQPPDRHRRLAEDRPALPQPDPRAPAAGRGRRAAVSWSLPAGWSIWPARRSASGGAGRWRTPSRPGRGDRRAGRHGTARRWPRRSSSDERAVRPGSSPRTRRSGSIDRPPSRRIAVGRSDRLCSKPVAATGRAGQADDRTGRRQGGQGEARLSDRAVSRHAADRGRRLGALGRLRGAGDRLLAEVLRPDPALCRHHPYRRRQYLSRPGEGDRRGARGEGHRDLRRSATIRTRCIPTRPTARRSSIT